MVFKFNPFTKKLDIVGTSGSGSITEIDAGTFINVTGSGDTRTISSIGVGIYVSPQIDFKVVGETTLFTTASDLNFYPLLDCQMLVDSSVDPVEDADFSIGWTTPDYIDFAASLNDGFSSPQQYVPLNTFGLIQYMTAIPPSTDLICKINTPDSGTTQIGRIVIVGFYA
jgi:hypothetical protein